MLTRRQHWWIGGIGLALAVGLFAVSFGGGEEEPFHKGKSLHEWLDSLAPPGMYSDDDPNVRAIVAIGSDAVPFLMRELSVSDSPWAERFRNLWSNLGLVRRPDSAAWPRMGKAYYCLVHLGPKADSALPELIKIAEDESHPSRFLAIELLGFIRSRPASAVPVLERMIAKSPNPHDPGCFEASIISLGRHGTNARSALARLKEIEVDVGIPFEARVKAASASVSIDPTDQQSLNFIVAEWENTNVSRYTVVYALVGLGTNAIRALPAMRRMALSDPSIYLRESLSNSIHLLETASGTEPSHPR